MINEIINCELTLYEWVTLLNALDILNYYDPLQGLDLSNIYDSIYSQLELDSQEKRKESH